MTNDVLPSSLTTLATSAAEIPVPLQSSLLGTVRAVRHGLTYRIPGLGAADGNIGLGEPRDPDDAWLMRQLWCTGIGVDPTRIVTMGQVHGNTVLRVGASDAGTGARNRGEFVGLGDALITDEPEVVLMSLHADCQPILLIDPDRPAVAAIHAGWRGTVADVGGATVAAMRKAYGSDPSRMLAFLGPAIGVDANEVGGEVIEAWLEQATDMGDLAWSAVRKPGPKHHFGIAQANMLLLLRAGFQESHIDISGICTRSNPESWFSHRGQGPTTGREAAIIAIAGQDQ